MAQGDEQHDNQAGSPGRAISVDLSHLVPTTSWVVHREPTAQLFSDDGENLLYCPNSGASLLIDDAVAGIWQCYDGVSTLGEISEDLVEVSDLSNTQALDYLVRVSQQFISAKVAANSPWQDSPPLDTDRLSDPPNR